MSSENECDTWSRGVQTIPPQAAQADNLARSAGSYHYETITFNIRREPSNTGALLEVIDVTRRTRIPGYEYINDPTGVNSYFYCREKVVQEVMSSRHRRLEPPKGNPKLQTSTVAAAPPCVTHILSPLSTAVVFPTRLPTGNSASTTAPNPSSTASSAAPATSKVSEGIQTDIPSRVEAGPIQLDNEIQYIKTVYPSNVSPNNHASRSASHTHRPSFPTCQLKLYDFFTHKKLKYAGLPPSLLAALEKSDAFYQNLLKERDQLNKDVAELWELKGETDKIFEAIQARIQPWLDAAAHAAASPSRASTPSDTSRLASPEFDGSVSPLDPASTPAVNQSGNEISDKEYLIRRSVNRSGKRPSLKRRASSASPPTAKKIRTKD